MDVRGRGFVDVNNVLMEVIREKTKVEMEWCVLRRVMGMGNEKLVILN